MITLSSLAQKSWKWERERRSTVAPEARKAGKASAAQANRGLSETTFGIGAARGWSAELWQSEACAADLPAGASVTAARAVGVVCDDAGVVAAKARELEPR